MKNQIPVKKIYTITLVARRCGLSTAIIRAWEQRYQAVRPKRSSSNRRLYNEKDILRLQLLKRAVDSGHRISQVANLPSEEL
ncbi:MAG: MerR family transcriptional regulator, partial [Deltaproteobacteria bacterium]|nr:MerR family transcriptional regulator [Deltaproteobacteria bacterium]